MSSTNIRGWRAIALAARNRSAKSPVSRGSLSGFCGDTIHQTWSRASRRSASRARAAWPSCTGLKEPPNSPIRRPWGFGNIRIGTGMAAASLIGSGPYLPRTANLVFERRQLLQTDRSAGMKLARRNADFCPEPELAAIRKLGRGIVQHDGTVDLLQEPFGRRGIRGNDRIGVLRAIGADMLDGLIDAVHHLERDDRIEELLAEVALPSRCDPPVDGLDGGIPPHLAAGIDERSGHRRYKRRASVPVDQHGFRRTADSGPPPLGIDRHASHHRQVGAGNDIDVANACEMGEHPPPRFRLDPADETPPAARNDDIDGAVKTAEHQPDRHAVGGRHQLNGIDRKAGTVQTLAQTGGNGARALTAVRPAAQDTCIAGLHAEPRR